jgi:FMN-dependent NADH-azoreductase
MKKTLLVSYTPRIGSNTKQLADTFIQAAKGKTEIIQADLSSDPPDLLLNKSLNAFIKNNYTENTLSKEEKKLLARNERMLAQVLEVNYIVVAYPMHNFSLPATLKAWLDAIIQVNKTFVRAEDGFRGLCTDKKALILSTSGYDYEHEPAKSVDFSLPLMQTTLNFIGIQSQSIVAYGLNQYADRTNEIIDRAKRSIEHFCDDWYGVKER